MRAKEKKLKEFFFVKFSSFYSFTFACVIEGQTAPPQLIASIALILKNFFETLSNAAFVYLFLLIFWERNNFSRGKLLLTSERVRHAAVHSTTEQFALK